MDGTKSDILQAAEMISQSLLRIASAIENTGCRIAEDEPLNYSIARGLQRIAEAHGWIDR
jgi:hypothetical protein